MGAEKTQKNGKRKVTTEANALPPQKSLLVAYLLWLFGGFFGLHHLYLQRDRHAFVWWCTLGGYFGLGWLGEIFHIPAYVRDANEDPEFIAEFVQRLREHRRPPNSTLRFLGEVLVGFFFGQLAAMAVPQTLVFGIDWNFLHWCIPLCVAVGVWTVGNIGRERGVLWHCAAAACVAYPVRYFIYDETYTFLLVALSSALVFDLHSKEWLRTPPKRRGLAVRTLTLGGALCIYCALWGSFVYFNGTISDEDGVEVPIHEALQNFLASTWRTDITQALRDTYAYAQHHGWYETWREIFESMDVDGERNSYRVLDVSAMASQSDITSAYRRLSKEFHPDKAKDAAQRELFNQRFIEIQQAYNVLSKIKAKRRRQNRKSMHDADDIVNNGPIVL